MMSLIPSDRTRTKVITVFAQPPMYAHWRPDSQNVAKMLMVSSPKYVSHDIGQWSSLSLKSRIIGADFLLLCILLALTAIILITLAKGRKNSVYLLEFACYRGPKSLECTHGLMTYGYRTFQLVRIRCQCWAIPGSCRALTPRDIALGVRTLAHLADQLRIFWKALNILHLSSGQGIAMQLSSRFYRNRSFSCIFHTGISTGKI